MSYQLIRPAGSSLEARPPDRRSWASGWHLNPIDQLTDGIGRSPRCNPRRGAVLATRARQARRLDLENHLSERSILDEVAGRLGRLVKR